MGDCLKKADKDDIMEKMEKQSPIHTKILIKAEVKVVVENDKITDEIINRACIKDLENTVYVVRRGELHGCNIDIFNCKNSILVFDEWNSQTIIDNCENCFIVVLCTNGSFFARKCTQCYFVVACYQFRISFSNNCIISLCALSSPTMEGCNEMTYSTFCYKNVDGTLQLLNDCALNLFNNKFNVVYDFNTQYSGLNENNYYIVPKKTFSHLLDEYKMVVNHEDYSAVEYLESAEELKLPYKSHKILRNQDTFIVIISSKDYTELALKLLNFDEENFTCVESFYIQIYQKDLDEIFKQIDKLRGMTSILATNGFVTLKIAPKIYMMIDQFTAYINEVIDKTNYAVFLNDDPDYGYVDKTIFTDIYNLGVNV